jgi:hypothetical protein
MVNQNLKHTHTHYMNSEINMHNAFCMDFILQIGENIRIVFEFFFMCVHIFFYIPFFKLVIRINGQHFIAKF